MKQIKFKYYKDIVENAKPGTEETQFLDFKRDIDINKKGESKEIALDICSFANAFGGSILIGIEEIKDENGKKVAGEHIGVDYIEEKKRFINDEVIENYYPKTMNTDVQIIKLLNTLDIIAINIKALESGIASVCTKGEKEKILFPVRLSYGKKYLNPFEVEARIMDNERKIYLRMQRLEQLAKKGVIFYSPFIEKNYQLDFHKEKFSLVLKSLNESEFVLELRGIQQIHIPYGLVDQVWDTGLDKMGVILRAELKLDGFVNFKMI